MLLGKTGHTLVRGSTLAPSSHQAPKASSLLAMVPQPGVTRHARDHEPGGSEDREVLLRGSPRAMGVQGSRHRAT